MGFNTALDQSIRWLRRLPGPCELCQQVVRTEIGLCLECVQSLPKLHSTCPGCGLLQSAGNKSTRRCSACLRRPQPFDFCRAGYAYRSPVSDLLSQFKFHARLEAGFALSELLFRCFQAHYQDKPAPELLLPVPLHPSRQRQRGFNQAQEIARVISQRSRIPMATPLLSRHRATAPQTQQASSLAREQNLRSAFSAHRTKTLPPKAHIALIDDVVTTMATAKAASRCLRTLGVARIDVWSIARAQR